MIDSCWAFCSEVCKVQAVTPEDLVECLKSVSLLAEMACGQRAYDAEESQRAIKMLVSHGVREIMLMPLYLVAMSGVFISSNAANMIAAASLYDLVMPRDGTWH